MTAEAFETLLLSYRDDAVDAAPRHDGGRVVDYVGVDVPRELIEAAGFLPRRLRATASPSRLAEQILGPGVDPAARRVLAGLLDPTREHGELLVLCHDTDSTVRLYTSLRALVREGQGPALPELYFLDLLHLPTETTAHYNLQRVRDLLAALEHRAGREVAVDDLLRAVAETNESRRLLLEMQALRRASPSLLGGADALAIIGAWSALPSGSFNGLLRNVLDDPAGLEPRSGTRVYLTGSGHHSPELYRAIEERGANVVGEDHDWGGALADGLVDEAAPPLEALTARYHLGSALGRRHSADERAAFAAAQAEAARADVVVAWIRAGDDALAWDVPAQRRSLAARGIPLVVLDRRDDGLLDAAGDLDSALAFGMPG
jgi:benzoyl-CoA reductase/2-hydroxyglutaryl-CoA dehydratase subunit BcrC/BadD/HgdB